MHCVAAAVDATFDVGLLDCAGSTAAEIISIGASKPQSNWSLRCSATDESVDVVAFFILRGDTDTPPLVACTIPRQEWHVVCRCDEAVILAT
jgi:hypothetical protein